MRTYILISALLVLLSVPDLLGQKSKPEKETFSWSKQTEVGFNFTPLISSLVPFNLGETKAGFQTFHFKRYNRKYAFRGVFGSQITDSDTDENFFLLTLGYERRRAIWKKITYTSGLDMGFFALDDFGNFTAATFFGFEYNFNEHFFAGTEANIQLLLGNNSGLTINPPTAIFLNIRW